MYLDIDGGSVYYQETGSGRPLILLHGWGQDVSSFWGLVPLLKNKFRLYLIDLPGFGRSELPKKSFTVQDYADVIKKFIKQKKLEKPTVRLALLPAVRPALQYCLQGNFQTTHSDQYD